MGGGGIFRVVSRTNWNKWVAAAMVLIPVAAFCVARAGALRTKDAEVERSANSMFELAPLQVNSSKPRERASNPMVLEAETETPNVGGACSALDAELEIFAEADPRDRSTPLRESFARMCEVLRSDAAARAAAVTRLETLDRQGSDGAASALASAIGLTPDPELVVRMASTLDRLRNTNVRCGSIRALSQNRYGRVIPQTAWLTFSGWSKMCARIEEPVARDSLIALARSVGSQSGRSADLTAAAIYQALIWSVDDPAVLDFLMEMSDASKPAKARALAMSTLRHSASSRATERMREAASAARDARETEEALGGLLARSDGFAIVSIKRMLASGTELERITAANAAASVLATGRAVDSSLVRSLAEGLRSDCSGREREAIASAVQPFVASDAVESSDRLSLMEALFDTARDGATATGARRAAVRSLNPSGPSARDACDRLFALAGDSQLPVEIRADAVKYIGEFGVARANARLEVAAQLDSISQGELPRDVRAAVVAALDRLESVR